MKRKRRRLNKSQGRGRQLRKTQIHDLPDHCLETIFSLLGNPILPIQRPSYRDLLVTHPLQCALVCQRWRSLARPACQSLLLSSCPSEEHLADHAPHFTNLRSLSLPGGRRYPAVLHTIATATPSLARLDLDWTCRCPRDVAQALLSWKLLRSLSLLGGLFGIYKDMQESLSEVLPKLTSLESLTLMYEGLDPSDTWEKLGPHMTNLQELSLQCAKPPPPCFATSLRSLKLKLSALPRHVLQFRNVVEIHLVGFQGEVLPGELGSMASLSALTVERSHSLAGLPPSVGHLSGLTSLVLRMCGRLSSVPARIGELAALEVFHLASCQSLRKLPESLGRLTAVRDLRLKDLPALGALPESLGGLSRLSRLSLESLWSLAALPESMGDLQSLQEMSLVEISLLETLPSSICELTSLQRIELMGCGIFSLPEDLGRLSALTSLRMVRCEYVSDLPDSTCDLEKLCELHIESCDGLFSLPLALGKLGNLQELVVRNCKFFSFHMDYIPRLRSLRYLGLAGCKHQYCLPYGWEKLTTLRRIKCSPGMIERAERSLEGGFPVEMEPDFDALEIEDDENDSEEENGSDDDEEEDEVEDLDEDSDLEEDLDEDSDLEEDLDADSDLEEDDENGDEGDEDSGDDD